MQSNPCWRLWVFDCLMQICSSGAYEYLFIQSKSCIRDRNLAHKFKRVFFYVSTLFRFWAVLYREYVCSKGSLTCRAVSPRQDEEALYPMATVLFGHENVFASVVFSCALGKKLSTRRVPLLSETSNSDLIDLAQCVLWSFLALCKL